MRSLFFLAALALVSAQNTTDENQTWLEAEEWPHAPILVRPGLVPQYAFGNDTSNCPCCTGNPTAQASRLCSASEDGGAGLKIILDGPTHFYYDYIAFSKVLQPWPDAPDEDGNLIPLQQVQNHTILLVNTNPTHSMVVTKVDIDKPSVFRVQDKLPIYVNPGETANFTIRYIFNRTDLNDAKTLELANAWEADRKKGKQGFQFNEFKGINYSSAIITVMYPDLPDPLQGTNYTIGTNKINLAGGWMYNAEFTGFPLPWGTNPQMYTELTFCDVLHVFGVNAQVCDNWVYGIDPKEPEDASIELSRDRGYVFPDTYHGSYVAGNEQKDEIMTEYWQLSDPTKCAVLQPMFGGHTTCRDRASEGYKNGTDNYVFTYFRNLGEFEDGSDIAGTGFALRMEHCTGATIFPNATLRGEQPAIVGNQIMYCPPKYNRTLGPYSVEAVKPFAFRVDFMDSDHKVAQKVTEFHKMDDIFMDPYCRTKYGAEKCGHFVRTFQVRDRITNNTLDDVYVVTQDNQR
jgi:hypothetical protein